MYILFLFLSFIRELRFIIYYIKSSYIKDRELINKSWYKLYYDIIDLVKLDQS